MMNGKDVKLRRIRVDIIVTDETTILPVIATLSEAIYRIGREYERGERPWKSGQDIQLGLMDDPGSILMPQRSSMTIEEVDA